MPLFDPPRHDSAETIKKALDLGVNVKMITGMSLSSSDYSVLAQTLRIFYNCSCIRGSTCNSKGNRTTLGNGDQYVSFICFIRPEQR